MMRLEHVVRGLSSGVGPQSMETVSILLTRGIVTYLESSKMTGEDPVYGGSRGKGGSLF